MKKLNIKKILSIFILAVFLIQALIPTTIFAATKALDYDNPNKSSSDNPYKVSLKGVLTSGLLTSLVGCTGVVSKVAGQTTQFAKDLLTSKKKKQELEADKRKAEQDAIAVAGGLEAFNLQKTALDAKKKADEKEFREGCLNGIATTLAKNQLTAMTKYTMNWINSGFNGDPLYVRNVQSYTDSITTELLRKEVELFKDPANSAAYPYGRDYAAGQINAYKSAKDAYGALKQDLTAYLPSGVTLEQFSNGEFFSWDSYLAQTSRCSNNPLCFTLQATENQSQKQEARKEEAKAEIARGGGVLDQKKCVEWSKPETKNDDKQQCIDNYNAELDSKLGDCLDPGKAACEAELESRYSGLIASCTTNTTYAPECIKFETVTPGSVIKAKIDTYTNSPERQIELAKTLNDALNALFSALINKFETQGLAGLKSKNGSGLDSVSGGFGSNSIVDSLGNTVSSTNVFDDDRNNRVNQSFDISRDLGNKYIQATKTGSWDADTNTPELLPGIGTKDQYYVVSTAGDTKLFTGTHHWDVGDKVYFDGVSWRDGVPKYIIESRGVFQLQKDYLISIKKTVAMLPQVVPKLAELDYCIPGPNTNWESNSGPAKDAYASYLDGISIDDIEYRIDARDYGCFAITCGVINNDYTVINLPDSKDWQKVMDDGRKLWDKIILEEFYYIIQPYRTNHFFGHNFWAVNRGPAEAQVAKWQGLSTTKYAEYVTKAKARYGIKSPMQNEYDINGNLNSAFLPMAQAGLDLTKDLVVDAEDVPEAIAKAEDDFGQASGNIYRLAAIKDKVNVIIGAAQKRRKDRRAASNLPDMPQICLDNEKVTYIEDGVLKY